MNKNKISSRNWRKMINYYNRSYVILDFINDKYYPKFILKDIFDNKFSYFSDYKEIYKSLLKHNKTPKVIKDKIKLMKILD